MKRNETTNEKILRLYNEGWDAEKIAKEVNIPTGSVHSILERRIDGYSELQIKNRLAASKAKLQEKETAEALKKKYEEELETRYSGVKKAPEAKPEDIFDIDLKGGMLIENYKQQLNEPKPDNVAILTGNDKPSLLTEGYGEENAVKFEETAEDIVSEYTSVKSADEAEDEQDIPEEAEEINEAEEIFENEETEETVVAEDTSVEREENVMDMNSTAAQKITLFAQAQISENEEKIAAINEQLIPIKDEILLGEAEISDINSQITDITSQIEELNAKLTELNERIAPVNEKIASLNEEASSLNEQTDNLTDENEQFRALMK